MSPWATLVGSLRKQRPPVPTADKGGRGVISGPARRAAVEVRKQQRAGTEDAVLRALEDGAWWKIPEITEVVGKNRMYLTKVLKEMAEKGTLEGVQNQGERREWYFRRPA